MTPGPQIPILERPAFFDGQRLTPEDFTVLFAHPRGVRWLHNRTLHGWGIGAGFDVTGNPGDRFVRIAPGYAIDCVGRDLLEPDGVELAVPQVSGLAGQPRRFWLTASYLEDADLAPSESRVGVCAPEGAVRRPERARLRWQDPLDTTGEASYRAGYDIVLAAVWVLNCRIAQPIDRTLRRDLTPSNGAYVGTGRSSAATTHWKDEVAGGMITRISAVIDTTAAGFGSPPLYFATLIGDRVDAANTFVMDGIVSVGADSASGFTATVTLSPIPPVLSPASAATTLQWHIGWIGVEL